MSEETIRICAPVIESSKRAQEIFKEALEASELVRKLEQEEKDLFVYYCKENIKIFAIYQSLHEDRISDSLASGEAFADFVWNKKLAIDKKKGSSGDQKERNDFLSDAKDKFFDLVEKMNNAEEEFNDEIKKLDRSFCGTPKDEE